MNVGRGQPLVPEDCLPLTTALRPSAQRGRKQRAQARMMEAVAAKLAVLKIHRLQSERLQARLHMGFPRQESNHRVLATLKIDQMLEEKHHAAAFGQQRLAGFHMCAKRAVHSMRCGQTFRVQLRIPSGQVDGIGRG